jgi:hypothetical protein
VAELQSRAHSFTWNRRASLMPLLHFGTINNSCDVGQ